MTNIRRAMFIGILLGSTMLSLIVSSISNPEVVWASNNPAGACSIHTSCPVAVQQWCDLITHYAHANNLDPNLIAAVILQESGGNPDAYSKSGAVGLMQVMPEDGLARDFICANGPCFAGRPSMKELQDPAFNIAFGSQMLSGLILKHGSIREALKAYGPMNVGYSYADIIINIYEKYQ